MSNYNIPSTYSLNEVPSVNAFKYPVQNTLDLQFDFEHILFWNLLPIEYCKMAKISAITREIYLLYTFYMTWEFSCFLEESSSEQPTPDRLEQLLPNHIVQLCINPTNRQQSTGKRQRNLST